MHTLKLTFPEVMYLIMVNIPDADGEYPVVPLGSALKSAERLSVVNAPVAVVVTTVAQVADEMAEVPRADVPLATVIVVPVTVTVGVIVVVLPVVERANVIPVPFTKLAIGLVMTVPLTLT